MRRSTLALFALLAVATTGCDKVKLAIERIKGNKPATQTVAHPSPAPADTTKRPATPPGATPAPGQPAGRPTAGRPAAGQPTAGQPTQPVTSRPPQAPTVPHPQRDVPYFSQDTGTIAPGMGERDVYSIWGQPVAVRREGEYTYLYFQNGCEWTCGMQDLVILQTGKVVDAVLRWPGHGYSGVSSSPPGKKPVPNPGGDTLRVKN